MKVLNIGTWELLVIMMIAILVVGPRRMIEIARAIGRALSQIRKLSDEFLGAIRTEVPDNGQETIATLGDIFKSEVEAEEGQDEKAG